MISMNEKYTVDLIANNISESISLIFEDLEYLKLNTLDYENNNLLRIYYFYNYPRKKNFSPPYIIKLKKR
jgi:hypothetical protein